ncbi:MAG: HNH endonuclease [Desulfobacteraceae bacterium IS3]|nr:MAG: HNH endonuclease [Desulfobacteraceae bacterium IS3]
MNDFDFFIEEEDIRRERNKARELRASQWWKRQCAKGVCGYCGRTVSAKELTMDHIVPISRGGKSVKGNVAACCKDCNNQKKQLLPMEWEQYLTIFSTEPHSAPKRKELP